MVSRLRLCGSPHLRLEGGDPLRALRPIVLAGRQRQHHVRRHRDLRGHQRVGLLERHRHRRRRDRTTIARTRVGRGPHAPALMVLSDLRRQRPHRPDSVFQPLRLHVAGIHSTRPTEAIRQHRNTGGRYHGGNDDPQRLHGSHLVLRARQGTHRAHTPRSGQPAPAGRRAIDPRQQRSPMVEPLRPDRQHGARHHEKLGV